MAMHVAAAAGRVRPQRPAPPPVPALAALDATHRRMMRQLASMARLLRLLADGDAGADARRLARQLCRFFGRDVRRHHADEEREVFPGLVRRGDPVLTQQVLRLQQDHGRLEEDWFQIEPQLQALALGFGGADVELLQQILPGYDALLREHIALEESLIYPAARGAG